MYRVGRLAVAVAFGVSCYSAALVAEPLPQIDKTLTQNERSLLAEVAQIDFTAVNQDKAHTLALLDSVLTKDPDPTPFRGYLQMMRAALLINSNRSDDAKIAIDESVRLLPGYSGPLLVAVDVYAYSNRPGEAADYLLRASDVDPQSTREVDDYEVGNLMHRLDAAQDRRRVQALGDRLLAIGWTGKRFESRSSLAYSAIERRLENHDLQGARALVPDLVVPSQTYALLTDNRYRELWTDLERWSGPKLAQQWKTYLTEARARFAASQSIENVRTYVGALEASGNDKQIIEDILPLMSQKFEGERDQEWVFVAAPIAKAFARTGRWSDLDKMYDQAAKIWPIGSSANALNIEANHAYYLLNEGRSADALKKMDFVLEDARHRGTEINIDAIAGMQMVRACALHQLGRDADAASSTIAVVGQGDPERIIELRLCLGDTAAAKAALLGAFQREETRSDAIKFMQKDVLPSCKSVFCARVDAAKAELRADPPVLAELQKYGRILPYAVNEAAVLPLAPATQDQSPIPVT